MGTFHKKKKKGLHKPENSQRNFITSLIVTSLFIVLLFYLGVDANSLAKRIILPLGRLFLIIALTLSISGFVEGMGWSKIIARYVRPLMKMGGFSDHTGIAFTTAFLSGVAANTMLLNAYEENKITERELFLSNLLNTGLPSYFLHLPTTIAIIVPLVGRAGAIYLLITFSAALLRTIVITLCGRVLLVRNRPQINDGPASLPRAEKQEKDGLGKAITLIKIYLKTRLTRIVVFTIPIYVGVVLAQEVGVFDWLQEKSAFFIQLQGFPVESVSVVAFTIIAEFTAGAAAAGAMLHSGILTVKETVLALVLGNVIATPFRAIRHQLPRYLGIYRPAMGIKLLVTGQTLRVVSVIVVTVCYVYWV